MLEMYKTTRAFLEANIANGIYDAPGLATVQTMQVNSLISAFKTVPVSMQDCTNTATELGKPTTAFTDEHRKSLQIAVAGLGTTFVPVALNTYQQKGSKTQTHKFMHFYLTDLQWDDLVNTDNSIEKALVTVADACEKVHLDYPSEDLSNHAHDCNSAPI